MNRIWRLAPQERDTARALFALLADVFGEPHMPRDDAAIEALLARDGFWAIAAADDLGRLVGGLTAHSLPTTHQPGNVLLIYDIAVHPAWQRQGVGRALVESLRTLGARLGIDEAFVLADNEDIHALDFYRALGGKASPVTMFDFDGD